MLFNNLRTEKDLNLLKRRIMKDAALYSRIVEIRKFLNEPRFKVAPNHIYKRHEGQIMMPTNAEVLELYKRMIVEGEAISDPETFEILKRLKVRSNSGVAVVSLLTKPYTCPGRCIYCPTEKNMPKSYLSREPAAARALANRFDPYKQIESRLRALSMNGHPVDKIEMIFIGGTFNFYDKEYQEWYTCEAFRACNNYGRDEADKIKINSLSLAELQKINETATARIIGLSIETRPDYITASELKWLRYLGVTKVELGVQHLDNEVLKFNRREMTRESIAKGTELLRDYGFKIVYHMMPNLPMSNPIMDVEMFRQLYNGLDFHPDMMKIYPNMIIKGSLLYKLVTQKKIAYEAYNDELLTQVLADAESHVPNYTRLIRMIRDIPADYILIGSKKSNLREEVDKYQKARGVKQVDIRAREIRDMEIDPNDFELTETWYETEHGYECFLQFENRSENKLAGFLRLRLPKISFEEIKKLKVNIEEKEEGDNWGLKKWRIDSEDYINKLNLSLDEALSCAALVRELHVYGTLKRVGEEGTQSQHTGMGKRLLARAEEIARGDNKYNLKYNKVSIIAGVGVREYYRKRGYELCETYMTKVLV